jgi:hypothetical protein
MMPHKPAKVASKATFVERKRGFRPFCCKNAVARIWVSDYLDGIISSGGVVRNIVWGG